MYRAEKWTGASRRYRDDGATAVEYALLIGLIAAVIIASVLALGTTASGLYRDFCVDLGAATGSGCL